MQDATSDLDEVDVDDDEFLLIAAEETRRRV